MWSAVAVCNYIYVTMQLEREQLEREKILRQEAQREKEELQQHLRDLQDQFRQAQEAMVC